VNRGGGARGQAPFEGKDAGMPCYPSAMRISEHPVLEDLQERRRIEIFVNGRRETAREGDTVAAALWALGIKGFRLSRKNREPRGPFCFMGRCNDCEVTVDGKPRVKACMTAVREGMRIDVSVERGA
jgi:hypothetical protein